MQRTTPDSQSDVVGLIPGPSIHPSGVDKLAAFQPLKDCECKCVRLYDAPMRLTQLMERLPQARFVQLYVVLEVVSILKRKFEFTFTSLADRWTDGQCYRHNGENAALHKNIFKIKCNFYQETHECRQDTFPRNWASFLASGCKRLWFCLLLDMSIVCHT